MTKFCGNVNVIFDKIKGFGYKRLNRITLSTKRKSLANSNTTQIFLEYKADDLNIPVTFGKFIKVFKQFVLSKINQNKYHKMFKLNLFVSNAILGI